MPARFALLFLTAAVIGWGCGAEDPPPMCSAATEAVSLGVQVPNRGEPLTLSDTTTLSVDAQGQLRVTFPQHPDVIATVTGLADTATRGRVVAELRVTGNPFIREQRLRLARVDDARLIALVWSVQSTDEIPSGPLALTYEADACQSPHPGGCFDYASLQLRASDGAQAVQVPAGTRAQLGDYEVINGSSLVAVSEIGCTDLSGQSYAGAIRALR